MSKNAIFLHDALRIASEKLASKQVTWCPIFADIFDESGETKLGHIVSDGYSNTRWTFYPADKNRRSLPVPLTSEGFRLPRWMKYPCMGAYRIGLG